MQKIGWKVAGESGQRSFRVGAGVKTRKSMAAQARLAEWL
jgi:hypothetical protein